MAEQRMRELEHFGGGVAWLAERLRRGDVDRSMVELAAYCGDAEAAEVADVRDEMCCCGEPYRGHTGEHGFVHACEYYGCLDAKGCLCPRLEPPRDLSLRLRGLERWPGALREAELACDVLFWGREDLAQRLDPAEWCLRVARAKGEQRVREAICERLREWALR